MGKVKPRHKNNRKHQTHPTGLPSVKDAEMEEAELGSSKDDTLVLNIIEEVQSLNIEERLNGLRSLADLAESSESVETIVKYKILKIIAPLLVDKSSEVRNITAGILRNLSATGSADICERLVKDDIMTPLLTLLQQYNDWKPESKTENSDTLLQVVNIIWNLCESDETALKYFNSANVLNILLRCLDYKTVGLDLSIAVCQCLSSVCEENTSVLSVLRSYESDLLSLLSICATDNKMILLKTLAAGIVVNLNPSAPWLASVLAVTAELLEKDLRTSVNQLSSQLPLDSAALSSEVATLVEQTEALTLAQTMALETLANLASDQDDEMETDSVESDDEDDINGCTEIGVEQPVGLNPEIHEGLEKHQMISLVLSKIEPLPVNVMDILSNCPATIKLMKRLVRLQCRAYLCLNNLVPVVELEMLGGAQKLYALFGQILSQEVCVNPLSPGVDNELLEAVTAAIRSILLRLAAEKCSGLEVVNDDVVQTLFKIGTSTEPRVQANIIRSTGTLGIIFNNETFLVKTIGNYLLHFVENQKALWLIAEALDTLLDLFAEDCTDDAAIEIKLVIRLGTISHRFKAKVRQERKTLGEHHAIVSTVMTNLIPFIKYKEAKMPR